METLWLTLIFTYLIGALTVATLYLIFGRTVIPRAAERAKSSENLGSLAIFLVILIWPIYIPWAAWENHKEDNQ